MLKSKVTIKESRKSRRLAGESAPNIVGDGGCRKARSRKDPQGQRGVQEPVGTGGGGEELMTIRARSAQIRSEDPILPRHKTDLKDPTARSKRCPGTRGNWKRWRGTSDH